MSYSHPLCQAPITPPRAVTRISAARAEWKQPRAGGAARTSSRHTQRTQSPGAGYCCKGAGGEGKTGTKNRYGPAAFAHRKISVEGDNSKMQVLPTPRTLPRALPPPGLLPCLHPSPDNGGLGQTLTRLRSLEALRD